jgi:DNA-binding MarR family transcriptional regulator
MAQAIELRRGALRLARRLRRERGESALSNAKLSVLGVLQRGGEMTARQLADAERVRPQTLTRTLRSLEADGLIARRLDPDDRRQARLVITDRGAAALAGEMAERDEWLAHALAEHLTAAERTLLELAGELMQRLAELENAPR